MFSLKCLCRIEYNGLLVFFLYYVPLLICLQNMTFSFHLDSPIAIYKCFVYRLLAGDHPLLFVYVLILPLLWFEK